MRDRRKYFVGYSAETIDLDVGHSDATKRNRIDLGLALLAAHTPRDSLSHHDIAAWCGCSRERIAQIERNALKKLRGAKSILTG